MIAHSSKITALACTSFAALAVALGATNSFGAPSSSGPPFPGLDLVDSKGVDKLYRRPDIDVSAYTKIRIGEPRVEFSKSWNPRDYGSFGLSASQLNKIRSDVAALSKSTFASVLTKGGYQVVTEAGADVLDVVPNVINLYINAPDTMSAGRCAPTRWTPGRRRSSCASAIRSPARCSPWPSTRSATPIGVGCSGRPRSATGRRRSAR